MQPPCNRLGAQDWEAALARHEQRNQLLLNVLLGTRPLQGSPEFRYGTPQSRRAMFGNVSQVQSAACPQRARHLTAST